MKIPFFISHFSINKHGIELFGYFPKFKFVPYYFIIFKGRLSDILAYGWRFSLGAGKIENDGDKVPGFHFTKITKRILI